MDQERIFNQLESVIENLLLPLADDEKKDDNLRRKLTNREIETVLSNLSLPTTSIPMINKQIIDRILEILKIKLSDITIVDKNTHEWNEKGYTKKAILLLAKLLRKHIILATIQPGTPLGIIVADDAGAKITQSTLDTKRTPGSRHVASLGIQVLQQIFQLFTRSKSVVKLAFNGRQTFSSIMNVIRPNIIQTLFSDVIMIHTNFKLPPYSVYMYDSDSPPDWYQYFLDLIDDNTLTLRYDGMSRTVRYSNVLESSDQEVLRIVINLDYLYKIAMTPFELASKLMLTHDITIIYSPPILDNDIHYTFFDIFRDTPQNITKSKKDKAHRKSASKDASESSTTGGAYETSNFDIELSSVTSRDITDVMTYVSTNTIYSIKESLMTTIVKGKKNIYDIIPNETQLLGLVVDEKISQRDTIIYFNGKDMKLLGIKLDVYVELFRYLGVNTDIIKTDYDSFVIRSSLITDFTTILYSYIQERFIEGVYIKQKKKITIKYISKEIYTLLVGNGDSQIADIVDITPFEDIDNSFVIINRKNVKLSPIKAAQILRNIDNTYISNKEEELRIKRFSGERISIIQEDSIIHNLTTYFTATVETVGGSLHMFLDDDYIDIYHSYSNDPKEIISMLGIEAAYKFMLRDISSNYENTKAEIQTITAEIIASYMTYNGFLTSFSYKGIMSNDIGPLSTSTLQDAVKNFQASSIKETTDPLNTVSSQLMTGKNINVGTGFANIKSITKPWSIDLKRIKDQDLETSRPIYTLELVTGDLPSD